MQDALACPSARLWSAAFPRPPASGSASRAAPCPCTLHPAHDPLVCGAPPLEVPPCHRIPIATPGVRATRDGVDRDDVQGRRLDYDGMTAWSKMPSLAAAHAVTHPGGPPARAWLPSGARQRAPAAWVPRRGCGGALVRRHICRRRRPLWPFQEEFDRAWTAEGWKGLFKGNGANCLKVAPSRGASHATSPHATQRACVRVVSRAHAARTRMTSPSQRMTPLRTRTPTLAPTLAPTPDLSGTQFLVFEYMKRRIVAGAFFFAAAGTPLNARPHGCTPPRAAPPPPPSPSPSPSPGR